jgi:hypothetical protein
MTGEGECKAGRNEEKGTEKRGLGCWSGGGVSELRSGGRRPACGESSAGKLHGNEKEAVRLWSFGEGTE